MPIRKSFCLLAMSVMLVAAGCRSVRSMTSRDYSRAAGTRAGLSDEYTSVQTSLVAADKGHLSYARWNEDVGQHPEALQRYREILMADPGNLAARIGIARIDTATGRTERAHRILTATALQHPTNPDVWLELGRIQAQRKAWPQAVVSLRKAAEFAPMDKAARSELGIAYARAGQTTEAVSHLEYAVGQAAAFYRIGYVLQDQGHQAEAATWFDRALEANPDEHTKSQAEFMLARTRISPSLNNVAQIGQPQQNQPLVAQDRATFQTSPAMATDVMPVSATTASTVVNTVPVAPATYTRWPQQTSTLAATGNPSGSRLPVVTAADVGAVGRLSGAPVTGTVYEPRPWNGPANSRPRHQPASGEIASDADLSALNGAIEPLPWHPLHD